MGVDSMPVAMLAVQIRALCTPASLWAWDRWFAVARPACSGSEPPADQRAAADGRYGRGPRGGGADPDAAPLARSTAGRAGRATVRESTVT
jgi:hypothetical protein